MIANIQVLETSSKNCKLHLDYQKQMTHFQVYNQIWAILLVKIKPTKYRAGLKITKWLPRLPFQIYKY